MKEKLMVRKERVKPRFKFENTVPLVSEKGHVKSIKTSQSACMCGLMTVDLPTEAYRERSI